jgi:hypothetical protein
MDGSETRTRRSVVEQFTRGPQPRHEPETEEADAYKEARARSREALMLDVILRDGTIESFDYAAAKRVTYKPDGMLILRFGKDTITVEGRNLHRVRQAVTECRARCIQEGTEAELGLKAEDAAAYRRDCDYGRRRGIMTLENVRALSDSELIQRPQRISSR